ncbi:MAG: hypothetical protein WDA59_10945 [Methanofastidiosum sp.]|jgi:septal ring factor EnvC (AmiA/AmiB activator)
MSIELTVLIGLGGTIFGIVITYLTFRRNANADIKAEATNDAEIKSDLNYIKKILQDIQVDLRLQDKRVGELSERVIKIDESSKSAHRRIDDLQKRLDEYLK